MKFIKSFTALAFGIFATTQASAAEDYVQKCLDHIGYSPYQSGAERERAGVDKSIFYLGQGLHESTEQQMQQDLDQYGAVVLFPWADFGEYVDVVAILANQQNSIATRRSMPLNQVALRLEPHDGRKYIEVDYELSMDEKRIIYQRGIKLKNTWSSKTQRPQFVYCFDLRKLDYRYRSLKNLRLSAFVNGQPDARVGVAEATVFTQTGSHNPNPNPNPNPWPNDQIYSVTCSKGANCQAHPTIKTVTDVQYYNCSSGET